MARKKNESVNESSEVEEPVVDTASPEEVSVNTSYDEAPVVEVRRADIPVPKNAELDIIEELKFARAQVEHCEDYINVPGADYKGRMRASIKEWRKYVYYLHQYACGNRKDAPIRPELPKDY